MARTMMIHAKLKWNSAINHNLWPYAMRYANQIINDTPMKSKSYKLPIAIMSDSTINPNREHYFPFGAPAFVYTGKDLSLIHI